MKDALGSWEQDRRVRNGRRKLYDSFCHLMFGLKEGWWLCWPGMNCQHGGRTWLMEAEFEGQEREADDLGLVLPFDVGGEGDSGHAGDELPSWRTALG